MTRKRYRKLVRALCSKMLVNDRFIGQWQKFIATRTTSNMNCNSYQDAWNSMKPLAELYGMKVR